jgi:hypothetical protein
MRMKSELRELRRREKEEKDYAVLLFFHLDPIPIRFGMDPIWPSKWSTLYLYTVSKALDTKTKGSDK